MEIKKISEIVWEIPKENGMNVPVRIFASEKMLVPGKIFASSKLMKDIEEVLS